MKRHPRESRAAKDGQVAGTGLATSAAGVLLMAYNNRAMTVPSASSKRWNAAWERVQRALGATAADVDVIGALRELDEAHGDGLVEHEDAAWHAAWTVAMHLRGGR